MLPSTSGITDVDVVGDRRRGRGSLGAGGRWRPATRRGSGRSRVRRSLLLAHQRGDLLAGQRAAQVAHRPAGGEHLRLVLAGALEDELALGQAGDRVADGADVDAAGRRAHPVEQALLVPVGLQPADHPRAGVGQRLVVDVDRVLRAEHDADAERSGLLHQRHDRLLRRRRGGGRQVAGDLVHVQQGAQVGRAALTAHPGDQLGQHQRRDELALLVAELRGRDDRGAGLAVGRAQHRPDVQRRAAHPRAERRRGEQAVEPHGERGAVLLREELVEVEHAELAQRRGLDQADQRGQVEAGAAAPGVVDQVGQQDVLAAGQRVGVDADEAEQATDEAVDLVADRLGVAGVGRGGERADDVQPDPAARPRRVDRQRRGVAQRADRRPAHAPVAEALGPQRGLVGGEVGDRLAGALGVAGVDPRLEVGRGERRERQAQVGEVALRVDQEDGHAGGEHRLDEHHAETGLARPGHPDDHPVGGQVARRQVDESIGALVRRRVDVAAHEEVGHARGPYSDAFVSRR